MSIYRHRMIRQMYKDIYLPIVCYASKTVFYSMHHSCMCMTECQFSRGSKSSRDSRNCERVKDPVSHTCDRP